MRGRYHAMRGFAKGFRPRALAPSESLRLPARCAFHWGGGSCSYRHLTIETGSTRWIVKRIYVAGKNELTVVEGFDQEDQEEVVLERMGQLIEEAAGKCIMENELRRTCARAAFTVRW
jgi:hypothetical protein